MYLKVFKIYLMCSQIQAFIFKFSSSPEFQCYTPHRLSYNPTQCSQYQYNQKIIFSKNPSSPSLPNLGKWLHLYSAAKPKTQLSTLTPLCLKPISSHQEFSFKIQLESSHSLAIQPSTPDFSLRFYSSFCLLSTLLGRTWFLDSL